LAIEIKPVRTDLASRRLGCRVFLGLGFVIPWAIC